MALSCLHVLIMLIMQLIRSFVCRERVLVGQWPERSQRNWATRTTGVPDVSSPVKISHPREIYASGGGGGLLVALQHSVMTS